MSLATLYAQAKGINAIYKSLQLLVQSAQSLRKVIVDVRDEQSVQAFYLQHDITQLPPKKGEAMSLEAVRLALALPHLLMLRYTQGDRFRSITIAGDLKGKYVKMEMQDFYVALSFLREEDLRNSDSYIRLEQQATSRGEQRHQFDLGQMATDYATEVLVNDYPRAIVMGNPGVGKSTFANWICHEWASAHLSLDRVPVHVNLKEVVTFNGEVSLLEYLSGQYVSAEVEVYAEVLKQLGQHFHFIFDGFDELSQENRAKFRRTLRQLKEGRGQLNYTILGRPYAFFDQSFAEAKKFRIRGFNEASIERYLEATVGRLKTGDKSAKELKQEVIDTNPTLQEYAHSPLILSYIVLVYLNDPPALALRKLRGINSKYGLYEEVYQWLADYNLRHRDATAEPLEDTDFDFARAVSFAKTFIYQSTNMRASHYHSAARFAAHGMGSLDRKDTGERWRFSFGSVALQEYLTARHLAATITAEQFVYLSRDTFFWNICQLIVGALTRRGDTAKLDDIFTWLSLEQEGIQEEGTGRFLRTKFGFFTYSLLAEGDERRLRKWANEGGINALFQDLVIHYFDDEWKESLLEATLRVYRKLRPAGQAEFKQELRDLLASVPQTDYQNRQSTRKLYVILDLAFIINAAEEAEFVSDVFDLLDRLLQDYELFDESAEPEDEENEEDDNFDWESYEELSAEDNNRQEVRGAIFLLLQLAVRAPAGILEEYRSRLEELYRRCPLDFQEDVVLLQSKITARADARQLLINAIQKASTTLPRYTGATSTREVFDQVRDPEQEQPFPKELKTLAHATFRFTRTAGDWNNDDVQLVLEAVRTYSDLFLNPNFWEVDGERVLFSTTLLEALADVPGEPLVLDVMHGLFVRADLLGTDSRVDFQDQATYWSRVEQLFTNLSTTPSVPGTELLAYLLHFVLPGHLAPGRFRQHFVEVADRFVQDKAAELSTEGSDCRSGEVLEQLLVAPLFEFDRNVSLSLVMTYSEALGNLRKDLLAELLDRRSAIYEDRYLDFIRGRMAQPGRASEIIEYLEWGGLYVHTSNISLLLDVFRYIQHSFTEDRALLAQHAIFLLMAGSKLTTLLSRAEDWEIVDALDELRSILLAPEVLELLMDGHQLEILTAQDLLGYPLLYAATEDPGFAVDFDYPHFRQEVPAEATNLLHLLCVHLLPKAAEEELAGVSMVSQGMPRGLYDDFEDYARRFYLQKERFSVEVYERIGAD